MFGIFGKKKQLIGRLEKVDFPELGIFSIDAKIDTGAYRSSIHADNVREENGVLVFTLLDAEHPQYNGHTYSVTKFSKVQVKSSNGEMEPRYKIKTTVVIAGESYVTDFTLSDRATMRYPVLIGRKVLRNRFIVDVSKS